MYQLFWILLIYAILGWCAEVSYAALRTGRFINRGFLNGPACPIYGFGMVIVLACLTPLEDNLFLLFLGSVALTSLLEWCTGFVLEKLFRQRWWDYSDEPFNLGGYICLRFSVMWGLACLFVLKLIHPTVLFFIHVVPRPLGLTMLVLAGILITIDLTATVRTIARINRHLDEIDEAAAHIREFSDEIGVSLAEKILDAAEKGADLKEDWEEWMDRLENEADEFREDLAARRAELAQRVAQRKDRLQELLDQDSFGQRRLLSAFPHMRSITRRQALEHLRRRMHYRNRTH